MNELFLCETPEDEKLLERCRKIRIKRLELGKWVYCPTAYDPETLETHEQMHEIFGGGDYTVEARDAQNSFLKNVRFQLPGKPKPLALEPEPEAPAVVAATVAPMQTESGAMVQLMMAQMQQTTQILVAVLSRGDSSSDRLLERSQQLEDRARSEHTEFLKTILERANVAASSQPAAGGSKESFIEGMEFTQGLMQEMASRTEAGGDDPASILNTIKQAVEGLGAISKQVSGSGPPATPPPPNGAA
jgi:hypothetical protein